MTTKNIYNRFKTNGAIEHKTPLQWRHNERNGVSNHQPNGCLLNCLFGCRWEKTSTLHVTGLSEGNSPVTGKFPTQKGPVTRKMFPFGDVIMSFFGQQRYMVIVEFRRILSPSYIYNMNLYICRRHLYIKTVPAWAKFSFWRRPTQPMTVLLKLRYFIPQVLTNSNKFCTEIPTSTGT